MTPTKIYDSIDHVVAFGPADEHRNTPGPMVDRLHAFAILDPSPNYPTARISLSHADIGAMSLTSEQAAQLEDRLARARADVDAATDDAPPLAFRYRVDEVPEAVYQLSCGRCDCCCTPIATGVLALAFWESSSSGVRVVLLHAERCPTWCAQRVTRSVPDPERRGGVVYEDAFCPRDAVATSDDGARLCGLCAGRIAGGGGRVRYDQEVSRG